MAFLDHVVLCNTHDRSRFRPFLIAGQKIGAVRHDMAERLAAFPQTFRVDAGTVSLAETLESQPQREHAVDEACRTLASAGGFPAMRGERYRVVTRWGTSPVMTLDRGVVSVFGVQAFGVHVNGMVRTAQGLKLWIGLRAIDKAVAPGKLDNMIAGGQPAGLGLMDNLVKEAAEEADVPESLARTARPVGVITYCLEDEWGLKPDVMFCYDLDVPESFIPRNTDGEMQNFRLMDARDVAALVRDTHQFKFNVNLVLIDFLIRHGVLGPENEPEYVELVTRLRRPQ